MSTPLSGHQVQQLVGLRVMLEDAVRRAQHAGPYRRATATVALDAAVERASLLGCTTLGLPVSPRYELNDLISRLRTRLDSAWDPRVLPDIRQLHRARNAAQHEGLEPDRDQIPLWSGVVQEYVASLVASVFGVDLQRVVLSQAIVDDELRELIAQAEEALAQGDLAGCAAASKSAFRVALDRWTRLHKRPATLFGASSSAFSGMNDPTREQLDELGDVVAASALAGDPAEVSWFRAAAREHVDDLSAEDVERMLSFAFTWVAAFDLAQQSWVPDRRARLAVAARRVRTSDVPASIAEISSVEDFHGESVRATVTLKDVPDVSGYAAWRDVIGRLLREQGAGYPQIEIGQDGTAVLTLQGKEDVAPRMAGLRSALLRAEEVRLEHARVTEAATRDADDRRTAFAAQLAQVVDSMPSWVRGAELVARTPDNRVDFVLLSVDEEAYRLRDPSSSPRLGQDRSLTSLLREHPALEAALYREDAIGLEPPLGPPELVTVLRDVDATVQAWLVAGRERQRARGTLVDAVRTQLGEAVAHERAEVPNPT